MQTRRTFLRTTAAAALARPLAHLRAGETARLAEPPKFTRTLIAGTPRERGRRYGQLFKDGIHSFLEKEIYRPFIGQPSSKDELRRYSGACAEAIAGYAPIIHEELEGMAEGSSLRLEDLVLITLHEELYHKSALPPAPHCTASAAGPPETGGDTFVAQTWDWMASVFGLSSMLLWERREGPSVLAYAFPGLWVGAGLNSAGLALCWTSADLGRNNGLSARVGIPSYVLLTHLLYQESLEAVQEEARRATHAGWFTFVMADGAGRLLNIEGSPRQLAIEHHRGRLARVGFGSRQMTGTPADEPVRHTGRCGKMDELLAAGGGATDGRALRGWLENPGHGISENGTIDMMVFNTTRRVAAVSRGPRYGVAWQEFGFDDKS